MIHEEYHYAFFVPCPPESGGRLWTVNGERSINRYLRAGRVKWWREEFAMLANECGAPHLRIVDIIAEPVQRLGKLADAGGHLPVVKAAVDGLVDAGVLEEDDGRFVRSLKMMCARRGPAEGLHLYLREVP